MIEILVSATVLMIVILCLRLLTKGRVSMRLRYALWLLVALPASFPVKVQILEEDNGLPRRFVYAMITVNSSTEEKWQLYVADRYDRACLSRRGDVPQAAGGEADRKSWVNMTAFRAEK
jgi:hypothetical protein